MHLPGYRKAWTGSEDLENQPTPKVLPARVWSQVLCAMSRWGHYVWLLRLREMGKDGLQARITALEEEVESVTDWQAIFFPMLQRT